MVIGDRAEKQSNSDRKACGWVGVKVEEWSKRVGG